MEMMRLEQKDANDWVYRGEGAVNLVLAYAGSSSSFLGKVMRIQKAPNGGNGDRSPDAAAEALSSYEKLVWREFEELASCQSREVMEQLYVKHVMSPLLGTKYVDAGMLVHVSKEFLENVEKNVMYQRPCWRVDAAKVDANRDTVLVMDDYTLFSPGACAVGTCLSVEIKPKCGFLPFSRFIYEGNAIKKGKTRFEMHQVLKLQEDEISELSEYCPLDLFSQSKQRICKAIKALYATPQNNFRVFLNGSQAFGGSGGGTGSTTFAIEQAFEDVLKGVIQADDGLRSDSFIELVSETIYYSGVLDQLLKVQQLDKYDIEGAIHAYYNIVSQPCMACNDLERHEKSALCNSLHSIPLDESLKIVKDYLISATAKDCSLMVSFRSIVAGDSEASNSTVYLKSTNQLFHYEIHFIDLALKPLKKMEDYYELDKKILTCYSQRLKHDYGRNKGMKMNGYGST